MAVETAGEGRGAKAKEGGAKIKDKKKAKDANTDMKFLSQEEMDKMKAEG